MCSNKSGTGHKIHTHTHTQYLCSCEQFCQSNPQAFTKQYHAFIWANRCKSDKFRKINQTLKNSTIEICSQSTISSSKKVAHPVQEQSVPPTLVLRRCKCVLCFYANTCKEWQFCLYITILFQFGEDKRLKGSFDFKIMFQNHFLKVNADLVVTE